MRPLSNILADFKETGDYLKLYRELSEKCDACKKGKPCDVVSDEATINQSAVALGKRGGLKTKEKGNDYFKKLAKKKWDKWKKESK